jgi:hypothetical protein
MAVTEEPELRNGETGPTETKRRRASVEDSELLAGGSGHARDRERNWVIGVHDLTRARSPDHAARGASSSRATSHPILSNFVSVCELRLLCTLRFFSAADFFYSTESGSRPPNRRCANDAAIPISNLWTLFRNAPLFRKYGARDRSLGTRQKRSTREAFDAPDWFWSTWPRRCLIRVRRWMPCGHPGGSSLRHSC